MRVCNPGACSSGCGQHPAAHKARWARPLPGSPVTHGVRPRRLGCGSDGCAASRARLHGSAAPAAPRRAALPRRPQPRRCGGGSLRPGARWPSHSSSGHGSQRGLPSCSSARRPRLRVLSGAGTSPGGLDSALYGARAWPVRGVAPTARTAALAWPSTARGVARGGPRPWQQRGRGGHTRRGRECPVRRSPAILAACWSGAADTIDDCTATRLPVLTSNCPAPSRRVCR